MIQEEDASSLSRLIFICTYACTSVSISVAKSKGTLYGGDVTDRNEPGVGGTRNVTRRDSGRFQVKQSRVSRGEFDIIVSWVLH